jgi:hypothetical protein
LDDFKFGLLGLVPQEVSQLILRAVIWETLEKFIGNIHVVPLVLGQAANQLYLPSRAEHIHRKPGLIRKFGWRLEVPGAVVPTPHDPSRIAVPEPEPAGVIYWTGTSQGSVRAADGVEPLDGNDSVPRNEVVVAPCQEPHLLPFSVDRDGIPPTISLFESKTGSPGLSRYVSWFQVIELPPNTRCRSSLSSSPARARRVHHPLLRRGEVQDVHVIHPGAFRELTLGFRLVAR